MIVDVLQLENMLNHDLSVANEELDRVSAQEQVLSDAARDFSIGASEALDSLRSYIDRFRRPAATVLRDYLSAYISDMHSDQLNVLRRLIPLGYFINTGLIQATIDNRRWTASRFEDMADQQWVDSGVAYGLRRYASVLRREASFLDDMLQFVLQYLDDTTIYARTTSMQQILLTARRTLNDITVTRNGVFDVSKVDNSWADYQKNNDYWTKRNKDILNRYLILNDNGVVVGFRLEKLKRYGELIDIARRCLLETGMPEEIDKLTDDEKYVVLWILSKIGPTIHDIESDFMIAANALSKELTGSGLAASGIQLYNGLEQNYLTEPITSLARSLISFCSSDDVFYSTYAEQSIQNRNGFSDAVELFGPNLGMDIETTVTTFVYENREYRIQSWDGNYFAGGTYGGEVGLYYRDLSDTNNTDYHFMSAEDIRSKIDELDREQVRSAFTTYSTVPKNRQPDMDIIVHANDGNESFYHSGYNPNDDDQTSYWLFACKPVSTDIDGNAIPGFSKNDTSVEIMFDFSKTEGFDPGFSAAMEKALLADGVNVSRDESGTHLRIEWPK